MLQVTWLLLLAALLPPLLRVRAQGQGNITYFDPEYIACVSPAYFEKVSHDCNDEGRLSTGQFATECRRDCYNFGYSYSYWNHQTEDCYCTSQLTPPSNEVVTSTSLNGGCFEGERVELYYLTAGFGHSKCANFTIGTPFLTFDSPTTLGCIQGCGFPTSFEDSRQPILEGSPCGFGVHYFYTRIYEPPIPPGEGRRGLKTGD
ncbi:hypothetical protein CI109_102382 [Kwoniella shandongensis]|uniref:Uncharacterized protein n=1 Tax=Kwoniella shandongensis TaxID=1734106 RepID=A0A5M6BZT7_9TREE|nr:uncharacterized protein CI109_003298 [Kwoniella shandongensis]KAA5528398.1 hypothetical protein CI109_003298 [Kwoniella shandongensis]